VSVRVLIADDHALLREGLRALLGAADGIEVVGEARDGREAIERTAELRPDVVLLDVAMPGLGGYEAALEIRRLYPEVRILVLTQYGDREYVSRFLKAGVAGYVLKKAAGSDLVSAIGAAARGGLVLDPEIARDALGDGAAGGETDVYETLTDREKQVLKLVAEGRANKEIASDLGISVKTAMTHREHVLKKLGLHGRTDLVRYAVKRGIVVL
jgi:DNA-binding NarL/FixJ family response regulator